MANANWRTRAATSFVTEKQPATGSLGMVVSNHPLASAAGAEMLAAGGNAVDAAIATLFALTVVEPMMVGIVGGGTGHIRLADGSHRILDGMSTVPLAGRPDMFAPAGDGSPEDYSTVDRRSEVGPSAVAAPGSLRGWCEALRRFGTFSLDDVLQPAIRHASRGFTATPYLQTCIEGAAADLARDKAASALLLPGGRPLQAGAKLINGDYAETLKLVAQQGEAALHGGPIGDIVAAHMAANGGYVTRADLVGYKVIERAPIRSAYRGFEIVGPPPPAGSGVHIAQMLNILEGYDIGALGFGTADTIHLLAEVLKIAFADRMVATGDPAFIKVPVEKLVSKDYAAERRAQIQMARAQKWGPGVSPGEGAHTTHMTAADRDGNVVATTQTINSTFGARYVIPGTGIIPNNYMQLFDPRPGRAQSVAPGKRVTTSMSPMMVLRDGRIQFALGLPGGKRIFPSAMQAIINLIDHGMSLQEAVEAPRVWTEGPVLELEDTISEHVQKALRLRGHAISMLPHVAGGMNGIAFQPDGTMLGAACWRADGTSVGVGGGLTQRRVAFWPDRAGTV
ncbi:MAG: gamma-glutamyltransferase [Acetobacteraceae bacterium]|nr:gamma-glutamyltransferase [Acetobacteraceae bacterium]